MILDTNALSAFIDGQPAVGTRLSSEGHAAIPVIVLGEFRYGISGSRYRRKYEQWLEDLQEGFTWRGVTVTNPFAPSRHALLIALLGQTKPNDERAT